MLRKFALLLALGMFSVPFVGCQKEEPAPETVEPAVVPGEGVDAEAEMEEDLGSDEAADDSNATTGN